MEREKKKKTIEDPHVSFIARMPSLSLLLLLLVVDEATVKQQFGANTHKRVELKAR